MTYAKVIADSVSAIDDTRLTTFEVRTRRFMLPEFNTHRTLSRNSASSRAIPFDKQVEKVLSDMAYPEEWATEQKGMQGGPPLEDPVDIAQAREAWELAAEDAIAHARDLRKIGDPDGAAPLQQVHKSIVNRLLEPFMWHTIVVTATAWENFFLQRCSPLAQPEIRVLAEQMKQAYDESEPIALVDGEWHLPYVDKREVDSEWTAVKVSAARCARVSYLTQDGKRDIQADLDLYERLVTSRPAHWSPLEHVATPWAANRQNSSGHRDGFGFFDRETGRQRHVALEHLPRVGNLLGWRSLRTTVEAELGEITFR